VTPPDVASLERAALTAVPAPRVLFAGPFVARAHHGGTGRGNAASSLDPAPCADLAHHVARVAAFHAAQGLRPRFRLTPLDPPGLDALLAAESYAEADETVVLAGPLAPFAAADAEATALDAPDEAWLGVIATAEYQTPARQAEKREMPALLAAPAAWMLLRVEGTPAAAAFVVADGLLCGVFDLAVAPDFRRQGLARRVVAAGAAWAAARGARFAYAQVAATNAPSRALFGALGLAEAYRYRYRIRE
jgi:ribosomal protein S18 acetylase RimI-like enzyme